MDVTSAGAQHHDSGRKMWIASKIYGEKVRSQ